MTRFVRFSNSLMILVLMGVLAGGYYQQFGKGELPCPMCMLQRLGMIGIATGLCLNLVFGIKIRNYAFSLLCALLGGSISLKQISLHVCPSFSTFGTPLLGYSLYSWAFLVFSCSLLTIIIFLFLFKKGPRALPRMNIFEKFAVLILVLLTAANVITTFIQCGCGPCEDVPWPQESPQTTLRADL